MPKSTVVRAAARFKQLASLGLASEAAVPVLLNELHSIIPSFSNTFRFADERGVVENIYFENTDFVEVFPLYQQEILERRDREFKGLAFSEGSRLVGVHEFKSLLIDDKTFQRSDPYNLVLRPVRHDSNFLRLYLRDGQRMLGSLTMWRTPGAGVWTSEEKRQLASLEAFFVHALTVHRAGQDPLVDSGRSGLIIANTAGKPVHFSAEGRRLLFMATNPRSGPGAVIRTPSDLPPTVVGL